MAIGIFKSTVRWDRHGLQCTGDIRGKKFVIDEPEELGGTDQGPNPVEYVLGALGGCLNILITSFAPKYQVEIDDVTVYVEGDLDPDGFTGKNPAVRPGFQQIRYKITIDSPSPEANIQKLLQHVETVCPVKDTLSGVPVLQILNEQA
ncbi:OsmC-like protein [Acididesulfobacillus acetoxydans]|uniref:OsmC-like protein n=1 Tax=Acididesulfobacillus acetoxydans TaxID=1561005 RepID=A0A8S0WQ29_9FIRM|nr:OsmC family protein [Acididesulfobacillus acetoxydans]CAA7602354.1 OsmC-like protein [Acididesulfobacillus acetoxydans]CEJ08411.1 OsmC-like protein [Acididesulfobacillus acetoxydans]